MSELRQIVHWRLEIPDMLEDLVGTCQAFTQSGGRGLAEQIEELALTAAFADEFPQTNPIHYGWFIESPLTRRRADLLRALLLALPKSRYEHVARVDAAFESALNLSLSVPSTLYVSLSSPAHVEGYGVIHWSHCPRCKAPSGWDIPRTARESAPDVINCAACGLVYTLQFDPPNVSHYGYKKVECLHCNRRLTNHLFAKDDLAALDAHRLCMSIEASIRNHREQIALFDRYPELAPATKEGLFGAIADLLASPDIDRRDAALLGVLRDPKPEVEKLLARDSERLSELSAQWTGRTPVCPVCHHVL